MKFFEFLDVIYLKKNLELQQKFDLKLQAETRAVPDLIDWHRKYYKFIAYFKLSFLFLKAHVTKDFPQRPELPKAEVKKEDKGLTIVKAEDANVTTDQEAQPS